jgi:K+-transporting ATPase ATPase C chain
MLRRQLLTGLRVAIVLIVLLGVVYPLAVWGVGRIAFRYQADGSFVKVNGKVVGSALIGQNFTDKSGNPLPQYFQPRPSAPTSNGKPDPYDPTNSGGSNLGPSNPDLVKVVAERVVAYRQLNGLAGGTPVPVDAVTASGSGLDPDISAANALDQAARIARARHLDAAIVIALVHQHTNGRQWGILGENTVNVLDLNVALDRLTRSG